MKASLHAIHCRVGDTSVLFRLGGQFCRSFLSQGRSAALRWACSSNRIYLASCRSVGEACKADPMLTWAERCCWNNL